MRIYGLHISRDGGKTFKLYTQLSSINKLEQYAKKFKDHWYTMQPSLCGKIIHLTEGAASSQQTSLANRYGGQAPNIYLCKDCSGIMKRDIYHVGYGVDAEKLPKRARRHRKEAAGRSKRSKRKLTRKRAKRTNQVDGR